MEEDKSSLEKMLEDASSTSSDIRERPKRLKREEKSEEKGDSSEVAGSSTSGTSDGFHKLNNVKDRNYRKRAEEESSAGESSSEAVESKETSGPDSEVLDSDSDNVSELSSFTVVHDEEELESDGEDHPVLLKEKPRHNWFIVPEIVNRQLGNRGNRQNNILFQRRCYGSLHSVERLELMYKLEQHEGCVNSLNFHPNGSLLASGSDDLKVVVWDWKLGKSLLSFETKHRGNVFQSKFLPLSGDLHIATSARDGQVRLHQVSKQEGLRSSRKLGCHRGPAHKIAVLCDQPHVLISVGEDGLVLSHDVRNSKPTKILNVKSSDFQEVALYSVSAHPLITHEFCVSGRDNIVRVYDQRKCGGNLPPLYSHHPDVKRGDVSGLHVTCAVYNYNGSEILASYNDDDIYIFEPDTPEGKWTHQYQGHRNGATIKGVNYFGPKSEFVVSGSDCGNVYFWDKNTEAVVQWMLADDSGVVNCLEPHPQLPFICTSGMDWDIKVWVPSCEHKPALEGLAQRIKANSKNRDDLWYSTSPDINESQMLWMLWRHLNRSSRYQRYGASQNLLGDVVFSSSSSSSSSESDNTNEEDDDDDDSAVAATGCTTS